MSNLENRIAALEGVGADRICIGLWLCANCPSCGALIWKERTTGTTRNIRPGEDFRAGIYRAPATPPPPHVCKV